MNEENNNSKNSSSRDKENQCEEMISLEGLDLPINEWLQGAIRDLKVLMYENPLGRGYDLTYIRYLRWDLDHRSSENDLNIISFFLKQIGIFFEGKEGSFHNFKHYQLPIHISVHQKRKGFIINSHIDVKAHIDARYSKFTSKILSDLSIFLKKIDTGSSTTTRRIEHPKKNETEVIELEIHSDITSEKQIQSVTTEENMTYNQNGLSQGEIPMEQTHVEDITDGLNESSQEETIANYQNEPVMYNKVNLNFFKTINILHEIVSEDYTLNEYIEQIALIKEFSNIKSINLISKKFLFLLTRVAGKHFDSSEFYKLISSFALWNKKYSKQFSNTTARFFKNRLLKEDFERINRAGRNYPIQNHIELRNELTQFNHINSIESVDLMDISLEVLNDFLAIKIPENKFKLIINIVSKAFSNPKERIDCFLTISLKLIKMLKGRRIKGDAFTQIINILFETISNNEEGVNFLFEIIKLLKDKKLNKLAEFIGSYILEGI